MVIDATRLAIYMVFVGDLDGIYIYISVCVTTTNNLRFGTELGVENMMIKGRLKTR
jgi:putative heme iron utilization protein